MENFNLKEYLAENRLLKEEIDPRYKEFYDQVYKHVNELDGILGANKPPKVPEEIWNAVYGLVGQIANKIDFLLLENPTKENKLVKEDNYDDSYDLENIKNTDILKIGGHLANYFGFPLRNVKIEDDIIVLGRKRYKVIPRAFNDFDIMDVDTNEIVVDGVENFLTTGLVRNIN